MHTRRALLSLIPVLVAACATAQPFTLQGTAPAGSDAFACVTGRANAAGYTVTTANRDAGTIQVEREESRRLGTAYIDRVIFSVYPAGGSTAVRAVASSVFRETVGEDRGSEQITPARPQTRTDVQTILAACAPA